MARGPARTTGAFNEAVTAVSRVTTGCSSSATAPMNQGGAAAARRRYVLGLPATSPTRPLDHFRAGAHPSRMRWIRHLAGGVTVLEQVG
jgi:hypothetical protein